MQVVRVGRFVGQKDEPNEPSGRHDDEAVGSTCTFHAGSSTIVSMDMRIVLVVLAEQQLNRISTDQIFILTYQ